MLVMPVIRLGAGLVGVQLMQLAPILKEEPISYASHVAQPISSSSSDAVHTWSELVQNQDALLMLTKVL